MRPLLALLTGLAAGSLLLLPGCRQPEPVERRIQRSALDLSYGKAGNRSTQAVEPRFRPFEELAAGIEPPLPMVLKSNPAEEPRNDPFFFPEKENNNGADRATEVSLPAILHGHMDPLVEVPTGDEDWYTFLVERDRPGVMDVELTGVPRVNLVLELYFDAFQGRSLLVRLDNEGPGKGERLPNFNLANGRYYVRILQQLEEKQKPRFDVVNPYRVTLTPKELSETEETEPNDGALSAVPLQVGGKMSGLINRKDDEDWYAVDLLRVSGFSRLSVLLLPPMGTSLELTVFTQTRQELLTAVAPEGKRLLLPNLAIIEGSGTYFLRVRATGKKLPKESYTLEVTHEPLQERQELEPDDVAAAALRLYWEEPISGWLSHEGDVDWYVLEPNHEWGLDDDGEAIRPALNIVLSGVPGIDVVLDLYDADKETQLARFDTGGRGDGEEAPNLAVPTRATYLKVYSPKGENAGAQYILQARAVTTDGKEVEPNNTPGQPTVVTARPDKLMGYLSPRGDRDCFRFEEPGIAWRVRAAPDGPAVVSAYDPAGRLFFQEKADEDGIKVPSVAGPMTLCLELDGGVDKAPAAPYILVPGAEEAAE